MRVKLWVISALLLLVASTGLAQTYNSVVTCNMDDNNVVKKKVIETKIGTIFITDRLVAIDGMEFNVVETKESKKDNRRTVEHFVYMKKDKLNRGYTIALSYVQNQLTLVELWKSRQQCTYYIITANERTTAAPIARVPTQPSSWGRDNYPPANR